ncbi:hypothetical protein XH83_25140 [Bradyrhizobium sp. CCBAU 53351]|nr:hypothetical protein XH83_25140 [Bradyrhizobium sp. CCBAU 53351]
MFGVAISAGPLMVLGHGLLSLGAIFTGVVLVVPVIVLAALATWGEFRPNVCDGLFAAFVSAVALSHVLNSAGDVKESALLLMTLALYVAGRVTSGCEARAGVVVVGGAVIAAGVTATAIALVGQWSAPHGKPLVFGEFDAAPVQFAALFGLAVIAVVTSGRLDRPGMAAFNLLVALSAAVFAASMVRFSLLAAVLAASIGILFSGREERRRGILVVGAMVIGIVAGLVVRWDMASIYATHALTAAHAPPVPSGAPVLLQAADLCPKIDIDNSIEIRKQLLFEALRLLPKAGLFGIGPGGFSARSCLPGHEVHNTILQVFVEFGWVAGVLLLALLAAAWSSVSGLARIMADYRFAACALAFVMLLSLVHGRISRDVLLMLMIGLTGHLRQARAGNAEKWMLGENIGPSVESSATLPGPPR